MSLETHLENLRAKPHHVRKRIAFWSSFGFTALIFMFWLASFSAPGTNPDGALASAPNRVNPPAESLIAGVGGFFKDLTEIFFKPKKIEYVEVEVTGGKK